MFPAHGSKTAQGHELQLGTNCLGPFLFTQLLTQILVATAKTAPEGSVRVIWASSSAAEHLNPWGGIDLDNLDYKRDIFYAWKYGISKAGNYYHATEYARRHRDDGIVSVVRFLFPVSSRLLWYFIKAIILTLLTLVRYAVVQPRKSEVGA